MIMLPLLVIDDSLTTRMLEQLVAVEKKAHGKRVAKIETVRNAFYRGPVTGGKG